MNYQSFPGADGNSVSSDKLTALRLPALKGKRFLDVGCNEGFFCGYALFEGATTVVGLDRSRAAISNAKTRFPGCRFLHQSWDVLPDGPFDVILLASALHYADDQAALIHRLTGALTESGTLVLEMGIAQPETKEKEWVSVKRSIDERRFPTRPMLGKILEPYAWKIIGRSVTQAGDPIPRYVVHVQAVRPYAFLMLDASGAGKSTLGRLLFSEAKVPVVSGDGTYFRLAKGNLRNSKSPLARTVRKNFSTIAINEAAERVFKRGQAAELVDLWCDQVGYKDFALDSYVPFEYRQQVSDRLVSKGYIPVTMSWNLSRSAITPEDSARRAGAYLETLAEKNRTSPDLRLELVRLNTPDIAETIHKWHLDSPAKGQWVAEDAVIHISGWVIPHKPSGSPIRCYLRSRQGVKEFDLNRRRPDAAKAFCPLGATSTEVLCGFSFEVGLGELRGANEFGFLVDSKQIPVLKVKAGRDRPWAQVLKRFAKLRAGIK